MTCLPGALTMIRYESLKEVAPIYFQKTTTSDMPVHDYLRFHLGEDRYLTHLLMEANPWPYQLSFCERAHCKTEAPGTIMTLLKQRRRWFLGALTNEVCMITTPKLWKQYPFLLIIRMFHDSLRSISLLFYVVLISMFTIYQPWYYPFIAIAIPVILTWSFMFYFSIKLHRFKILAYPIMYFLQPIMMFVIAIYACFTYAKRTWGGPRTDAHSSTDTITNMNTIDPNVDENAVIGMYSDGKLNYMNNWNL